MDYDRMRKNNISLPDLVMDNSAQIQKCTDELNEPKLWCSNHSGKRMLQISKNIPSSYLSYSSPNHGSQPMSLPSSLAAVPSLERTQNSNIDCASQTNRISQELTRPPLYTGEIGELRSICEIPPKYRSVFSNYPSFNVIQSKALDILLYSDRPLVISAPTGSGKTVIFELAIINLLMKLNQMDYKGDFKIVYMAPVKALCTERYHDWQEKFSRLGLKCHEVTGDSFDSSIADLQKYNLVLTTPEKWDSLTRKWKQNKQLVQLVKLFLIDEVHLLNEEKRGPVLEAVVSRMKTIQETLSYSKYSTEKNCGIKIPIRFIAVSATIPNIEDLAVWLGDGFTPAEYIKIGEEYRPVKLNKVILGFPTNIKQNPFLFDMNLNYKLRDLLFKYAEGKPTLIFCSTRKGVIQTAQTLAKEITFHFNATQRESLLHSANNLVDKKIRESVLAGVGSHHAGMDTNDRHTIEDLFRGLLLPVLVTTSTLAMGVNLPAHLVIVKSTQQYIGGIYQDYSETQILQMIGRAGRPQFDKTATAVIMTRQQDKARFERLVDGKDMIESTLHRHLAEHLNSEVVLETITEICIAMNWLSSTFLYVRALKNPTHYGFPMGLSKTEITKKLQDLCLYEMNGLATANLMTVVDGLDIRPTDKGRLMASFYLSLETMKVFNKITGTECLNEMILVLASCQEFSNLQLRRVEKRVLNELNKIKDRECIRFPIKGPVKDIPMKVNVLIQATLGCLPINDHSLYQDSLKIMRVGERITRSLTKFLLNEGHYKSLLNAALLAKCFASKIWENSIYVTKQLNGIGATYSNLLASAGKTTFQSILVANPRDLERILSKAPPLGNELKKAVRHLPKYKFEMKLNNEQNEATITLQLENLEDISEFATAGYNHWLSVIVGDNTNRVLHNERLNDNQLIQMDGLVTWDVTIDSNVTEIYGHVISDQWVGIDVEQTVQVTQMGNKPRNVMMKKAIENYVYKMGIPNPLSSKKEAVKKSKPTKLSIVEQIRLKGRQLPELGVKIGRLNSETELKQSSLDQYLYTPAKRPKLLGTYDEFIQENAAVVKKLDKKDFQGKDILPSIDNDNPENNCSTSVPGVVNKQTFNIREPSTYSSNEQCVNHDDLVSGEVEQDHHIHNIQPSIYNNEQTSNFNNSVARNQYGGDLKANNSLKSAYNVEFQAEFDGLADINHSQYVNGQDTQPPISHYESYRPFSGKHYQSCYNTQEDVNDNQEETQDKQANCGINFKENQYSTFNTACYDHADRTNNEIVETISSDDEDDVQWVKTYQQEMPISEPGALAYRNMDGPLLHEVEDKYDNTNNDMDWKQCFGSLEKIQWNARKVPSKTCKDQNTDSALNESDLCHPKEEIKKLMMTSSTESNVPRRLSIYEVPNHKEWSEKTDRQTLRRVSLDNERSEECADSFSKSQFEYSKRMKENYDYVNEGYQNKNDCSSNQQNFSFSCFKSQNQTIQDSFFEDGGFTTNYDAEHTKDFSEENKSSMNGPPNATPEVNLELLARNFENSRELNPESILSYKIDESNVKIGLRKAVNQCSKEYSQEGTCNVREESYRRTINQLQDNQTCSVQNPNDACKIVQKYNEKEAQDMHQKHGLNYTHSDLLTHHDQSQNEDDFIIASTPQQIKFGINKKCLQKRKDFGAVCSKSCGLQFGGDGKSEINSNDKIESREKGSFTPESGTMQFDKSDQNAGCNNFKHDSSQKQKRNSVECTKMVKLPIERDKIIDSSKLKSEILCKKKDEIRDTKNIAIGKFETQTKKLEVFDSITSYRDRDCLEEKPKIPKHHFPIFISYDLNNEHNNPPNEQQKATICDSTKEDIFDSDITKIESRESKLTDGQKTTLNLQSNHDIPKLAFDFDLDTLLESIDVAEDTTCGSHQIHSPSLKKSPIKNKITPKVKPGVRKKRVWDPNDPLMALFYGPREKKTNRPFQSKDCKLATDYPTKFTEVQQQYIEPTTKPIEIDSIKKNHLSTRAEVKDSNIVSSKKSNGILAPQGKLFPYCAGRAAIHHKTHSTIKLTDTAKVPEMSGEIFDKNRELGCQPAKPSGTMRSDRLVQNKTIFKDTLCHVQEMLGPLQNVRNVYQQQQQHQQQEQQPQQQQRPEQHQQQQQQQQKQQCQQQQQQQQKMQQQQQQKDQENHTKPLTGENVTTLYNSGKAQEKAKGITIGYQEFEHLLPNSMVQNIKVSQAEIVITKKIYPSCKKNSKPSISIPNDVYKAYRPQCPNTKSFDLLGAQRLTPEPMAPIKIATHGRVGCTDKMHSSHSEPFNTLAGRQCRQDHSQLIPLHSQYPEKNRYDFQERSQVNLSQKISSEKSAMFQLPVGGYIGVSRPSSQLSPDIFSQCSEHSAEYENDDVVNESKFKWISSQETFTERSQVDEDIFSSNKSDRRYNYELSCGEEPFGTTQFQNITQASSTQSSSQHKNSNQIDGDDWQLQEDISESDVPFISKKFEYNHTEIPKMISMGNLQYNSNKMSYQLEEVSSKTSLSQYSRNSHNFQTGFEKNRRYENNTKVITKVERNQSVFEQTRHNMLMRVSHHGETVDQLEMSSTQFDSIPNANKLSNPKSKSTQFHHDCVSDQTKYDAKRSSGNEFQKEIFYKSNIYEIKSNTQPYKYSRENLPISERGQDHCAFSADQAEASHCLQPARPYSLELLDQKVSESCRQNQNPAEHRAIQTSAPMHRQEMFRYCQRRSPGIIDSEFNLPKPKHRRHF